MLIVQKHLEKFKVLEESHEWQKGEAIIYNPSLPLHKNPRLLPPKTLGLVQHSPMSLSLSQSKLKVSQSSNPLLFNQYRHFSLGQSKALWFHAQTSSIPIPLVDGGQ